MYKSFSSYRYGLETARACKYSGQLFKCIAGNSLYWGSVAERTPYRIRKHAVGPALFPKSLTFDVNTRPDKLEQGILPIHTRCGRWQHLIRSFGPPLDWNGILFLGRLLGADNLLCRTRSSLF